MRRFSFSFSSELELERDETGFGTNKTGSATRVDERGDGEAESYFNGVSHELDRITL